MGIFPNIKEKVTDGVVDAFVSADINHNDIPDVLEGLDAIRQGLDVAEDLTKDLDHEEIFALLQAYNALRKPEKRRSNDQLNLAAISLSHLHSKLEKLEVEVVKARTAITAKAKAKK